VRRAALAALEAGAVEVIVVVGAHAESVTAALAGIANVAMAPNPDWESGLASSLKVGLKTATELELGAAMVMTSDQPLIDVAHLKQILNAFDDRHRIVAAAYDDIVGVPVLFGSEHFESLMTLTGDEGAGRWLRTRLPDVVQISIDTASIDIDTPADIALLQSHTSPGEE